jgi:hypothetical protein
LHKSTDILAADQRYVLAELLLVQLDQPAAMPDFFLAHLFKYLSRAGKILSQALAEVGVDTCIFFLQRNRQGKDFFLRQAVKVSQGRSCQAMVTVLPVIRIAQSRQQAQARQRAPWAFQCEASSS